jgi:hypothetical protein
LEREQAAKDAINNAFVAAKKRHENSKEAKASSTSEDQYHHLLSCLEKTTV